MFELKTLVTAQGMLQTTGGILVVVFSFMRNARSYLLREIWLIYSVKNGLKITQCCIHSEWFTNTLW